MNDNDLRNGFDNNGSNNDNTYRATTNLNTAIENPNVNINSVMGVNIQDVEMNNSSNLNNSYEVNQNNPNYNQSQNNLEQSFINNDINNQVYNNSQTFINNDTSSQNVGNINMNNSNDGGYQAQFIMGSNPNSNSNSNLNSNMNFGSDDNYSSTDNGDANAKYEPTLKTKKKPSSGIVISKEAKAMFVIVLILSLFIFVLPNIYDFFREMDLVITNG